MSFLFKNKGNIMESIYFAYTFNEGFDNVFHTGPMAVCTGEDIAHYGIPFIVNPRNSHQGIPALGELLRHASYISESTFFELEDLHAECLHLNNGKHIQLAHYIESILDASPFSNDSPIIKEESQYTAILHM